jgi:hypothetical protein
MTALQSNGVEIGNGERSVRNVTTSIRRGFLMTKIAFRWFYRDSFQYLENVHKNADGTLIVHTHSSKLGDRTDSRDITAFEMLRWAEQENVTFIHQ